MADQAKIPEPRDDDPEDVSDKLAIAAAMWSRGDRADAVNWLRRAAESASDAELDLRALELAKLASELTSQLEPAPAPVQTAGPPPKPAPVAAPKPAPAAAAAPKPPPKPSTRPPSSRPPGGKLPPLPPLRPLGSPPAAPPKAPRLTSMITSASGVASASGTIDKRDPEPPPPSSKPAESVSPSQMPWDAADDAQPARGDDEPTHQIALPALAAISPLDEPESDMDKTVIREAVDPQLLSAMRAAESSDGQIRAAAAVPTPQHSEPPPTRTAASASEETRSTREPPYLPLAVGVRVRLVADDRGVRVVPDDGTVDGGITAIVVPANVDDDLRALFARARG